MHIQSSALHTYVLWIATKLAQVQGSGPGQSGSEGVTKHKMGLL